MSAHPDLTPLLRGDAASPARRRALLDHLQGCSVCRTALAQEDPSALFSLLALEPVPQTVLARVSRGVSDKIAREAQAPTRSRRRYALGALAASLLLAGFLGLSLLRQAEAPSAPVLRADREALGLPDPERPVALPAGLVEVLKSHGSAPDVVQMSVGEDVDFIMIFDAELGI